MVSTVIDPINQSFCSFSVTDNGRILEGKKCLGAVKLSPRNESIGLFTSLCN